jgi:diamine N-acetyltransferase
MTKRSFPPIETERLRLRLLEERDLPLTRGWRNQEHVRRWFFHDERITPRQQRAWYAEYLRRDDDFVLIIEERGRTPRPIGQIALYHVDWTARRAEFGRLMIGPPDACGKGLATEAARALLAAAPDRLSLEEVYLEVLARNARAIKVYAACGFRVVGRDDAVVRMSLSLRQTAAAGKGDRHLLPERPGGGHHVHMVVAQKVPVTFSRTSSSL